MTDPIRLAVIGAGIFTRDAHLPALLAHGDRFRVVGIYSRGRDKAAERAAQLPYSVDGYDQIPALLARPEVEAAVIVLPIDQLPAAVDLALAAGKHVISEKPIAPTLEQANRLLNIYRNHPGRVWMVGENWRYEAAFEAAAELIASGAIGRVLAVNWALHIAMLAGQNKYYATDWRRAGTFMGGFLLDGGVHYVAALRLIAGEIERVAAFGAAFRPDLPPADTLAGVLHFSSGAVGSLVITFATEFTGPHPDLLLVGTSGTLTVSRTGLTLTTAAGTERRGITSPSVEREYGAFAAAIRDGQPHRNTPEAAAADLRVVAALLRSWESGRAVTVADVR